MRSLIDAQHGYAIAIMDDKLVDRTPVLGDSPEGGVRQIESLQEQRSVAAVVPDPHDRVIRMMLNSEA